jgi:hypothetical protein
MVRAPRECRAWVTVMAGLDPATTLSAATPGAAGVGYEPQLHPVVDPQVSHFKHVPFRTSVKFAHSGQDSPS